MRVIKSLFLACMLGLAFTGACAPTNAEIMIGDAVVPAQVATPEAPVDLPKMPTGYGLYGSKITVNGAYPGYRCSDPIIIINGQDRARTFELCIQQPGGSLTAEYEALPREYFGWFLFNNWFVYDRPQVEAEAGEVLTIPIVLKMPASLPDEARGKRYDVRILVKDLTEAGFSRIVPQEKWLISVVR